DGDGLTNREEYRLGTRPDRADSDGDGVNDADELRVYNSDPLVKDTPPPVLEEAARLAQWSGTPGSWLIGTDGTLVSMARRGEVSWEVEIAGSGVYLIEVVAGARGATDYVPPVPVTILIDGLETVTGLVLPGGQPTRIVALTRALAVGTHRVTIDSRNVRAGVGISVVSVNLYRHVGLDEDSSGIPDWLENLCRSSDRIGQGQSESAVSPACIEGEARFTDDVTLAAGGVAVPVQEGLRGRWFANVPLAPSDETNVTVFFENGLLQEEHLIRWTATNLFDAPETLRLRVGDSLKLVATPSGADEQATVATVALDGEALGGASVDDPLVVTFDQPGSFVLAAHASSTTGVSERNITVEVLAAEFGPGFDLASGTPRIWDLPGIPRSLVIESDPELSLVEMEGGPPESRRFTASYPDGGSGTPRVLARLSQDGPVAAATRVNVFYFVPASVTGDHQVIQVLPDGTRVVAVRYVIDGVIPGNLSIWLQLGVTDALFADGDTWHQLTAADFNENGEARILIYKAPGAGTPFVCHWIRPFHQREPADLADPADGGDDSEPPAADTPEAGQGQ
ncbi:MAG: hypothetical protein K9N23_23530, partial [Akkermansiaceae bacterium]|nr:hypothetical protein [Akkermansiaceae bacterium]